MEGHTYHPLAEMQLTRIVTVEPGAPNDIIRSSLCTIPQDINASTSSDYDALSYVWGSPILDTPIICDGQTCTITSNLDQALRHFRKSDQHLNLWVDALCINQKDAVERSKQVTLMKLIYKRAKQVCIWLGDEEEEDPLVMRLLNAHVKKVDQPWFHVRTEFRRDAPEWAAMIRWLNRPWFWRVWTIQEARLTNNAVVHFGRRSISLGIVDSVLSLHLSRDVNHNLAGHLEEAFRLPGLSVRLSVSHTSEEKTTLLDLLLLSRRHQATDPRDKVYGLLGLVRDMSKEDLRHHLIKPDYTKSKEVVYKDTAIFVIERGHSLKIIQAVYHGDEFVYDERLPSWIPCWDQQDGPILFEERSRGGSACRDEALGASIAHQVEGVHNVLSVSGAPEATVRTVLPNMSQEELEVRGNRGHATVFDHLWAEMRNEYGSPLYLGDRHLILEFIEALTIGINGRGESFRYSYEGFFATAHYMWGHALERVGSSSSSLIFPPSRTSSEVNYEESLISNTGSRIPSPVTSKENHEKAQVKDNDTQNPSPVNSTAGLCLGWEEADDILTAQATDSEDEASHQVGPMVDLTGLKCSNTGDYDDEEASSHDRDRPERFRCDPGQCLLCHNPQEQNSRNSLHSYLTRNPNRENLPGSVRDPHTFQYRINDFFTDDPWYYNDKPSLDFLAPCIDACHLRRFFITNDQRIGIGPRAMRAGDMVVCLLGATMPCVLRKAGIGGPVMGRSRVRKSDGLYHFIGECYVQGPCGPIPVEQDPGLVVFDLI